MGSKRAGEFAFTSFNGDHAPLHVHIEDSKMRAVGRWDIENQRPLDSFELTRKLRAALLQTGYLNVATEES